MTVKELVLNELKENPGSTDGELSKKLGKIHQHINQTCRDLVNLGMIERRVRDDGFIGNYLKLEDRMREKKQTEYVSKNNLYGQKEKEKRTLGTLMKNIERIIFSSVNTDKKKKVVCGYEFSFIQQIEPKLDEKGNIVKFYPQDKYDNIRGLPLSIHGGGAFCEFSINAKNIPGVYLWVVDDKIIYIGETSQLAKRFNTGYGKIYPRNCYVGGQNTNCKMNKVVLELFEKGKKVDLYFYNTFQYKMVEKKLLGNINTIYNVKDNK